MPESDRSAATGEEWLDSEVARRLFARRQLLLHGPLDSERATRLAAELMTLEADAPEPVTVSVNSTGGDLHALFTVTDTMQAMHARVDTRCLGQGRGTAVALVAAGTGRRRAARHAQLTLCLPEVDVSGTAVDVERAARAHAALNEQLFDLLVRATERPREQIVDDWQRGQVMSAHQAVTAGLIDEVTEWSSSHSSSPP